VTNKIVKILVRFIFSGSALSRWLNMAASLLQSPTIINAPAWFSLVSIRNDPQILNNSRSTKTAGTFGPDRLAGRWGD